jgi:fumarate reductase flavoprotein subunit
VGNELVHSSADRRRALAPSGHYRDKGRATIVREDSVSETWDLIVCGAGTTGMPAAIFAAQRGATVLVLESAPEVGGTLHVAMGQISAAGTRVQAAKGIEDSADRHYADIVDITEGRTTKPFARLAADHSADTLHWLLDLGWEPLPEHPVKLGHRPYSVARTYWGAEFGVSILKAIQPVFLDAVARGDIALRTTTEVVDLVTDGQGRVTGVTGRGADGKTETFAGKKVLLATGGFGAGHDFFKEVSGYPLHTWAYPYCQGGGARLALKAGAEMWHRDYFIPRWAGVATPESGDRVDRISDTTSRRPAWEIYVTAEGKRFVPEDVEEPLAREQALLKVPDLSFWVVYDETVRREAPPFFDTVPPEKIAAWMGNHPSFVTADTLAGLAAAAGIDPANLAATVAAYNAAVDSGDDALGRKHLPRRIENAPFYAVKHHGAAATTIPGVSVNERLEVVRGDGSVVENLYAAGEILGMGLHSANTFVGGLGLMPALTYGRLLGQRWLQWDGVAEAAE